MPLLEINQSRHICASVRLDEVTATQVDQYAALCVCEKARAMVRRSSRQRSLQPGSSPRLLCAQ